MKDTLTQFTQLRNQLLTEKADLEARLGQLNQVLGQEAPVFTAAIQPRESSTGKLTMRNAVIQALSAGPLKRKELAAAVQNLGYRSKNILNSMGIVLYGKAAIARSLGGRLQLKPGVVGTAGIDSTVDVPRKKRKMSLAARKKIATAQRARWAKVRAGK